MKNQKTAVNFTQNQRAWANAHDWFAFATPQAVYGWNIWAGNVEPTIEKITSFEALRSWAGY